MNDALALGVDVRCWDICTSLKL